MNSGKKLAIHVAKLMTPHLGGIETYVGQLTQFQRKNGLRVVVITSLFDPKLKKREVVDGVEIYRIQTGNKLKVWSEIWRLKKLFASADRIYIHDVAWWLVPLWPSYRHKITLTFHGWEGLFPIPQKNILKRRIWSALADQVIHVGAWIGEFYGDRPDQVIYGGIEAKDVLKSAQTPQTKKIKYAFVGRLEKENAIDQYLELAQKLPGQITWIGAGADRSECQKTGQVTGMVKDVQLLIDQADVIFANSYLSIWQALGRGKLVVSLHQHDLKKRYLETFPAAGVMVLGNKPDQVAKKVLQITQDKEEWQRRGDAGLELARHHTWQKVFR